MSTRLLQRHMLARVSIALFFVLGLALTPMGLTTAQTPEVVGIGQQVDVSEQTRQWWDTHRAIRCGRYWCSQVYFYELTSDPQVYKEGTLRVAIESPLGQPQDNAILQIEQRAELIQRSFDETLRDFDRSLIGGVSIPKHDFSFWLPELISNIPKAIHPKTPKVDIDAQNQQVVIVVSEQPELGLAQHTIVTVTSVDARANTELLGNLIVRWRMAIETSLSDILWGWEFDRRYPWFRPLFAGVTLLAILGGVFAIGSIRYRLWRWQTRLQRRLSELIQLIKGDPEAALALEEDTLVTAQRETDLSLIDPQVTDIFADLPKKKRRRGILGLIDLWFHGMTRWLPWNQIEQSVSTPGGSEEIALAIQKQAFIRQQINVLILLRILLLSALLFVIFFGTAFLALIFRETRLLTELLLGQALFFPIILAGLAIGNSITDFAIDHLLNNWAKENQARNSESNRSVLRARTYSPVLRGTSSLLYSILGIGLIASLFGINLSLLTGAGAVAVVIAFLSRNILENLLNGILILWTDRFALGDMVEIDGSSGFVEEMNLYTTSLRNLSGEQISIPNGQIGKVTNTTKDWSRVNFEIDVAADADISAAIAVIQQTADTMQQEANWKKAFLEPISILGVDRVAHEGITIRALIKTPPRQQWILAREFRLRVRNALCMAGIPLGIPQRDIRSRDPNSRRSPL